VSRVPAVSAWRILIAAGGLAGIALRIWVLTSPLGALDADEAVRGLMARHALHGELSVFYWGQAYGGTQEALLTAAAFALFGSGTIVLKAVPICLYAIAAVLVWLVGRRTVGERSARAAALLVWIWPPFLVWWSTKAYDYSFALVCSLVVLLLALRLAERPSRLDVLGLGLASGLGIWSNPQILLTAIPTLAWLAFVLRRRIASLWPAAPVTLVALAPALAWNANNGWLSLRTQPALDRNAGFAERLLDVFATIVPTWLGLRVPSSLAWVPGRAAGVVLLVLVLLAFVVLLVRRPRRSAPLLAIAAAFPLLVALSPYSSYVAQPRYMTTIAAVPALLLAIPLTSARRAAIALVLALTLTVGGLTQIERDVPPPRAVEGGIPTDISPLLSLLEHEGVSRVFVTYWLAYRITFESAERIVATSTTFVRYQPHDRLVRRSRHPAWVFLPRARDERRVGARLLARGYRRVVLDRFVVYLPPRS
jgi:4-amino-4-deoxy-L-arabinose transferase-like glycosyltransferase